MDLVTWLQKGLSVLVDIKTKDGKIWTGWIDKVGMTQSPGKIILANQIPHRGSNFDAKIIKHEDVDSFGQSTATKPNF